MTPVGINVEIPSIAGGFNYYTKTKPYDGGFVTVY